MAKGGSNRINGFAVSSCELLFKKLVPLRWMVRELVPEGTTLLAGRPKSGKSWLALNLLIAARINWKFLDREVVQCEALYLALEENELRMQSRLWRLLKQFKGDLNVMHGLEYQLTWPRGVEGAKQLDEYLVAHPHCKIVAVDVLKKIRPPDRRYSSGYDLDYEAIEPWKAVADKHRITLILVHHTRKAQADDVFDEISGTLGINGSVDQMIVLRRVLNQNVGTLHMRGRDLPEDIELSVELDEGWWQINGSIDQIGLSNARKQVLELLATDTTRIQSTVEIQEATGRLSRTSTAKFLKRMADDSLIKQHDRGWQAL